MHYFSDVETATEFNSYRFTKCCPVVTPGSIIASSERLTEDRVRTGNDDKSRDTCIPHL